MKFGICNEIFQDWTIEDAMTFARRAGYDGLEIAPFTLARSVTEISPSRRQAIRESARRIGLEITGLHWVLVQTEGLHLTHPDPTVRARTAAYFCELVDCCADLSGRTIVIGSPKQRNRAEDVTIEQARDWATETLRPAVGRAGDRGITLCFEPLSPAETNFINTAADAIDFTRRFANPAIKIILDVKAMCSESKPIPQIITDSAGQFAYFHANDRNLKGPGFGDVDFRPIASALESVRYDGYVSVEVFKFEEGAEVIATRSIDYLKRTFAPATNPRPGDSPLRTERQGIKS